MQCPPEAKELKSTVNHSLTDRKKVQPQRASSVGVDRSYIWCVIGSLKALYSCALTEVHSCREL